MDSGKAKTTSLPVLGTELEQWCRNIVTDCYIGIAVNFAVLAGIWYFFAFHRLAIPPAVYWLRYILGPTALMLLINGAADRLIQSRRLPLIVKEYTALLLILLLCASLCLIHSVAASLLVTFVLPVFISTIFSRSQITARIFVLSFAAQLLCGIKMHFFSIRSFGVWLWVELIVSAAILIVSYFMARTMIRHGQYQIASLARSYSESRTLSEQLQRDDLTNLYNRKAFRRFAFRILTECQISGAPLSFAMLDMDDFKSVNDTFGHVAGDTVLLHLAEVLQSQPEKDLLAFRLGGEEFGLLMADCPLDKARRICEKLSERMKSARIPEVQNRPTTFSCGIACTEGRHTDISSLYAAADAALYRAKYAGKNKVELYTGRLTSAVIEPDRRFPN